MIALGSVEVEPDGVQPATIETYLVRGLFTKTSVRSDGKQSSERIRRCWLAWLPLIRLRRDQLVTAAELRIERAEPTGVENQISNVSSVCDGNDPRARLVEYFDIIS